MEDLFSVDSYPYLSTKKVLQIYSDLTEFKFHKVIGISYKSMKSSPPFHSPFGVFV
jgi:hypothetical protein